MLCFLPVIKKKIYTSLILKLDQSKRQVRVRLGFFYNVLEDTSSSCRGLRPLAEGFFCPKGKKRAYYAVLAHFWQLLCPVVTLVTFSSNLGNF